ncbi:MAG: phosphoribosylformylglycinamidine synthase [Reichenbachiella sp.]
MKLQVTILVLSILVVKNSLKAQEATDNESIKVLHAEPLYIDLIRDLGARKGEKEWNVGFGITDNLDFDTYEGLVEYEWAPVNNLGFEIEVPFLIYANQNSVPSDSIPSNRMESLKLATQWTFLVSQNAATSMALGYINEMVFSDFQNFGNPLFVANIYNPFVVIAKRWGDSFHTLIYTGPVFEQVYESNEFHTSYEVNSNIHYMIPKTRNFIGIEFNKEIHENDFDMTIRPQMRIDITEQLLIGIVTGIPISRENERLSMFLRLIYEPH